MKSSPQTPAFVVVTIAIVFGVTLKASAVVIGASDDPAGPSP